MFYRATSRLKVAEVLLANPGIIERFIEDYDFDMNDADPADLLNALDRTFVDGDSAFQYCIFDIEDSTTNATVVP